MSSSWDFNVSSSEDCAHIIPRCWFFLMLLASTLLPSLFLLMSTKSYNFQRTTARNCKFGYLVQLGEETAPNIIIEFSQPIAPILVLCRSSQKKKVHRASVCFEVATWTRTFLIIIYEFAHVTCGCASCNVTIYYDWVGFWTSRNASIYDTDI